VRTNEGHPAIMNKSCAVIAGKTPVKMLLLQQEYQRVFVAIPTWTTLLHTAKGTPAIIYKSRIVIARKPQ
jgi:hypothetical protein